MELDRELVAYYIENDLDMSPLFDLEEMDEEEDDEMMDLESDESSDGPTRVSRILKIHHNMYCVDTAVERSDNNSVVVNVDDGFRADNTNFSNIELEEDFYNIVSASKYSNILNKWDFNKEIFIEFFDFCISKLYPKFSINNIFLYLCNYYDITNISGMFKSLPFNMRSRILNELKEFTTDKIEIEEGLF